MRTPYQVMSEIMKHTKFGWQDTMLALVEEYVDARSQFPDKHSYFTAGEKARLTKQKNPEKEEPKKR